MPAKVLFGQLLGPPVPAPPAVFSKLDSGFLLWFVKSYRANEVPPFGVLAETAGGTNPYFATGAGGMLQTVLFGFGGLDIGQKGITHKEAVLPKGWKRLVITGVGPEKITIEQLQ